jgi:hypothetical protein
MSESTKYAFDQNSYRESVEFKEKVDSEAILVRSKIQTSHFLALTQDAGSRAEGVYRMAGTADHTIHGDVVRICGPIKCPGRSIKIVCRVLQFAEDSQQKPGAIIVDETPGKKGDDVTGLPKNGGDGVVINPSQSDTPRGGGTGDPGLSGNPGHAGERGGTIEIYCGTLELMSSGILSAAGGMGGEGSKGTAGGTGGNGEKGRFHLLFPDVYGGFGGDGGPGGPGESGGNGGMGGSITLHYRSLINPNDRFALALNAKGGQGGDGAKGGDGGKGGDRGKGTDRIDLQGPPVMGGDGGASGMGGNGGHGGEGGQVYGANAQESKEAKVTVDVAHGERGKPGKPGEKGEEGRGSRGWRPRVRPVRPADEIHPSTVEATATADGSVAWTRFTYPALRPHLELNQLRMLIERLRYLYLRIGRLHLGGEVETGSDCRDLLAGIQWIEGLLAGERARHMDGVVRDSHDGTFYFFYGDSYIQIENNQPRRALTPSFQRILDKWKGLVPVDTCFNAITFWPSSRGPRGEGLDGWALHIGRGLSSLLEFRTGDSYTKGLAGLAADAEGYKILRGGIDVAFNTSNDGGRGLIFKNGQYYRYSASERYHLKIETSPHSIAQDFPGLWTEDVAAAFSGEEDKVFFFQKPATSNTDTMPETAMYMAYDLAKRKVVPGYPRQIVTDWPLGVTPPHEPALLAQARALANNLRLELDYFGNPSTYVCLGTQAFFDDEKAKALKHLKAAEKNYRDLRTALTAQQDLTASLELTRTVAKQRESAALEGAKKILKDAQTSLAEINRIRNALDLKAKHLSVTAGDLKSQVKDQWGISWQDLFGCLTQASFMHWGNLPQVESGPALMAVGQFGELITKGVQNVVTDSGESLTKANVVHQVDTMSASIKSFQDLTLKRTKFIDSTNLFNDAYKLTMTRDQFKGLCADLVKTFPAAKEIMDDLDEYVMLADQRNAAVLQYNQFLLQLHELDALAAQAKLDHDHADSHLTTKTQPSLPLLNSFAAEVYNRSKDLTLRIYYEASRAAMLTSLEPNEFFSGVLQKLPATGQIDSATLEHKDLNDIYDDVLKEINETGPKGSCKAHVVFSVEQNPEVFEELKDGIIEFTLRCITDKSKKRHFTNYANVRLREVRCWGGGLEPNKAHSFRIIHTGRASFLTTDNEQFTVEHQPKYITYEYTNASDLDPTGASFVFQGSEDVMHLTDQFALMGPFTRWRIELDNEEDRKRLRSLRVEFAAMGQTVTKFHLV